jgi:hypothetical protein
VHVHRCFLIDSPADAAQVVNDAAAELQQWQPVLSADALPRIEALLALGEFSAVGRLLHADPGDALLTTIVLGRAMAWSADLRAADALRAVARHAVGLSESGGADPFLMAAACAAAERLAADLAEPQLAVRARAAARSLPVPAVSAPEAALLAGILGVPGKAGGPPAAVAGDVAAEADVVYRFLHLVHHALGIEPDAPRHRLRLQPDTRPWQVREIPFGDGSISLEVRPGPDAVEFTVEQESGAIPVTLLLEPLLPTAPVAAFVDGVPADLAPRWLPGGGIQLPVQLVLDAPRRLTVQMQEGRPPE